MEEWQKARKYSGDKIEILWIIVGERKEERCQ